MRTRYRYDRDMDCVVEIRDGSNFYEEEKPRGPNVISDSIGGVNGIRHMPSGKHLDSKSAHYKATKAAGLEHVGMETNFHAKPETVHRDYYGHEVKAAAEQLQGNHNGTADWARQDRERVDYMKRNQR